MALQGYTYAGCSCTLCWINQYNTISSKDYKKALIKIMIDQDKLYHGAYLSAITSEQMRSNLPEVFKELGWKEIAVTKGPHHLSEHGLDMHIWMCDLVETGLYRKCREKLGPLLEVIKDPQVESRTFNLVNSEE